MSVSNFQDYLSNVTGHEFDVLEKTPEYTKTESYWISVKDALLNHEFDRPIYSYNNFDISIEDVLDGCDFYTPIYPPENILDMIKSSQSIHRFVLNKIKDVLYDINMIDLSLTNSIRYAENIKDLYVSFTQKLTFASSIPLYIFENKDCLKYIFSHNVSKVEVECLGEVSEDEEFICKDKLFTLYTGVECQFEQSKKGYTNTLKSNSKMKMYNVMITYKLPWYVVNVNVEEPMTKKQWWHEIRYKFQDADCGVVSAQIDMVDKAQHKEVWIDYFYREYLRFLNKLNDLNPCGFINFDCDKNILKLKREYFKFQTTENGVEKFGGQPRNEDEYYDKLNTVSMLSFPYTVYLEMLGIFKCCKENKLSHFAKERRDKGKAHKSHIYEYYINGERFQFEGKVNELYDKLKAEIEDCPKSKNTMKNKYNIKKLI